MILKICIIHVYFGLLDQILETYEFSPGCLDLFPELYGCVFVFEVLVNQAVSFSLEPLQVILLLAYSVVILDCLFSLFAKLFLLVQNDHLEFFFSLHVLPIQVLNLKPYFGECLLLILDGFEPESEVTVLHFEPLFDIGVGLVTTGCFYLSELTKKPVITLLQEELSEAHFAAPRSRCLVLGIFNYHLFGKSTHCVDTV